MAKSKPIHNDEQDLVNMNFKVPQHLKDAFTQRCLEDRETYSSMLRKLMDDYTHRRIEYITNIEIRG